ncbi:unnamed protein product [Moneuplotes crassus]|uniref:Uncharacterized protein n=1 Tax=Euplotes crassus TaxID=5936 RepID=A0AAD1XVV1_EUPCR|nr:unnamed protein product [Moneuplotes crassus]
MKTVRNRQDRREGSNNLDVLRQALLISTSHSNSGNFLKFKNEKKIQNFTIEQPLKKREIPQEPTKLRNILKQNTYLENKTKIRKASNDSKNKDCLRVYHHIPKSRDNKKKFQQILPVPGRSLKASFDTLPSLNTLTKCLRIRTKESDDMISEITQRVQDKICSSSKIALFKIFS